jgi:hypothetical protein
LSFHFERREEPAFAAAFPLFVIPQGSACRRCRANAQPDAKHLHPASILLASHLWTYPQPIGRPAPTGEHNFSRKRRLCCSNP